MAAKKITTREELETCRSGQKVDVNGRVGVYAGLEYVHTCGCVSLSFPNTFQIPTIIYHEEDGSVTRQWVYSLENPVKGKITAVSISETVNEEDPGFSFYSELLGVRN